MFPINNYFALLLISFFGMSGTAKASEHWRGGVGEVGQGGVTELSSGYKVILPLKCLKTKFRYLLIS